MSAKEVYMQKKSRVVPTSNLPAEAIAIVGMSFRLPGDMVDEQMFWQALMSGQDLVTQVPADRWAVDELQHAKRSEPGKSVTYAAGVLSDIDKFDAAFFGISPREAAMLDPQQRLLLEMSWEAMENAGWRPSSLAGTDCAVYVGISGLDYGTRGLDDLATLTAHSMTGNTLSIAANRISYVFDLHGPSLAVDTACSSSMVALHHACTCLLSGQSSTALVGGVNMLLHPYPFVGFTKASMLSADGRCKVFDASGDGYVRAEGGAVFLLKKLQDAVRDGDQIQAVIRATGVNADGGRKSGITIPSHEGQAELMRAVLQKAAIHPEQVDFIEAHGTGTMVGDPIEAHAIGTVYGAARTQPLPIGSVKANVGHLESASGMAGLVKTVLALKHAALPPALHLNTPNPNIDFKTLNLQLVHDAKSLSKPGGEPLIAGLNSFGFGGANAHVVLQSYPQAHQAATRTKHKQPSNQVPLLLSARNQAALQALAGRYADFLQSDQSPKLYDVAYEALTRRDLLSSRLLVPSGTRQQMIKRLRAYAAGQDKHGCHQEEALANPGRVAFVYSGNGAQWHGMGCHLLESSEVFRSVVTTVDGYVQAYAGFSVLALLQAPASESRLDDTAIAQPLLFAVQVGLTAILKSMGIAPHATAGHSVGEVAAAWAAGALDLAQATRVICARSAAQAMTRGSGTMAAVAMSASEMQAVIDALPGSADVSVAGINSPANVTVSGSEADIVRLQDALSSRSVFFKKLDLDYAFHTHHMDSIAQTLRDGLSGLRPSETTAAQFVSTVTGDVCPGEQLDAHYWWLNIREPVQFDAAICQMAAQGCQVFVEIGPNPILQRYIGESLKKLDQRCKVLSTMRKTADQHINIEEVAWRIMLLDDAYDWQHWFPVAGNRCQLPNYPWQKERHWQTHTVEGLMCIERRREHPLLGWRLADAEASWENTLDPQVVPWLADHKVGGAIVYPGAAYVEMALAAAHHVYPGERLLLEALEIIAPLVFDEEHARTLRLVLNVRDHSFYVQSKQRLSDDGWSLHCVGRILQPSSVALQASLPALSGPAEMVEGERHYALAASLGLEYGPAFQGLRQVQVAGSDLLGFIDIPETLQLTEYYLHPALLDLCYQSLVDFYVAEISRGDGVTLLPIKTGRLTLLLARTPARFRTRRARQVGRSVVASFEIYDDTDTLMAKLDDCRFRVAPLSFNQRVQTQYWSVDAALAPHPLTSRASMMPAVSTLLKSATLMPATPERQKWFKESLPLLEALTLSYVFEAVQSILDGGKLPIDDLMTQDMPLSRWMLALLQQEGLLIASQNGWQLQQTMAPPPSKEIWQALFRDSPECLPQLTLMGRMGTHLPAVLTGEEDISTLYHSLWSTPLVESLYEADPCYAGINQTLLQLLRTCIVSQPSHRKARILEVSPVASGLLAAMTAEFTPDQFEYVLAVGSESAASMLQADMYGRSHHYAAYFDTQGWKFAGTDAEVYASNQALFDVVVIRHVLHQTQSATNALAQVKSWLAPGGIVLLAERYPDLSADLIHGLAPLWWVKQSAPTDTDALQYSSSLYPPQAWQLALQESGFSACEVWHERASDALSEGVYLLAAQRPKEDALAPVRIHEQAWQIYTDDATHAHAEHLEWMLQASGQNVKVVCSVDDLDTNTCAHVVWMAGWEQSVDDSSELLNTAIRMVNRMAKQAQVPRLWVLTRGAALAHLSALSDIQFNPLKSAIWGWARVVMNEYPQLQCKLIDCNLDMDAVYAVETLRHELLSPDNSSEVLLHGQVRSVLRMHEAQPPELSPFAPLEERFKLDFLMPGQLRNLQWLPVSAKPLAAHEVEVQVHATGLNFRDVMYVMGLLPDEAVEQGFAGPSLGLEFAGVVSATGDAVRSVAIGDAVMGFGRSCFASHVTTTETALAKMPDSWSFESAATVPTVFFTVYYALKHLANLQAGERVLIHGAAGGVGLAAIQLALHLGAEVYATAGSDEKRELVTLLGADHVLDSRTLDFADLVMASTAGEGVDVILNSLAGEAIRRNLSILRPFGRFLELGKRDFFENTPVGLRPFKDNISYFGIDADQLLTAKPQLAKQLFQEVMALFAQGVLTPLPYRSFVAPHVVDAFRFMQQSRQIGKVIVRMADQMPVLSRPSVRPQPLELDANSTWLVTGGLASFGAATVHWLVAHGVKHLLLISRRGMQTPGADRLVEALQDAGVQVLVKSCDVADKAALQSVLDHAKRTMPPLRGVLHAATSYADQFMHQLEPMQVQQVMDPKLLGAWHLHTLTIDIPLTHFVLYSSVTTLIGNPGQANYVAANAGLEGLSRYRQALGLPAVCVGWGPIADTGYLARHQNIKDSLEQRMGKPPLASVRALDELERILQASGPVYTVANFDWRILAKHLPSASADRYDDLKYLLRQQAGTEETLDIKSLIAGKTEEEVKAVIANMVSYEVAQILCMPVEKIDTGKPLHDIGLDSLMAVELALGLEKKVGIQLPVMMLNDSPTVERVAGLIVKRLLSGQENSTEDMTQIMVQQLATQHGEQASAEEIETFVEEVRVATQTGLRASS